MDVGCPVRMHQALDNENEPSWTEVKNLKVEGGGSARTFVRFVIIYTQDFFRLQLHILATMSKITSNTKIQLQNLNVAHLSLHREINNL